MGNECTHNFENIKEEVVISQVEGVGRLSSAPSEPPSHAYQPPQQPIDQEAIHSILRRQEPVVHIAEE